MRRIALGAAVAALLVVAAVAFGAGGSVTPGGQVTRSFTPGPTGSTVERERGQDLLVYWGQLSPLPGTPKGGYFRARCVWLRQANDDRMGCDIVVMLEDGSLILEGMVNRPTPGPFADPTTPLLAVTGGTREYAGRRGDADVDGNKHLVITLLP
jgi:hypothetical protein